MNFDSTSIAGLMLIQPFFQEDGRGTFVKSFHAGEFEELGLRSDFRESYYSGSVKNVIRGMHFQWPPYDHAKLVFCTAGEVLDVVVDLRKDSDTFGQCASFSLSAQNHHALYIPNGMAHGFCVVSTDATMMYFTTREYHQDHDTGIRYDSFGFNWPVNNPIVSERDSKFIRLEELESPF